MDSKEKLKQDETSLKLEGHSYDGIEELDNQLPRWWLWSLYLCIAFAGAYFFYYQIGEGTSVQTAYRHEHEAAENARFALALQQGGDASANQAALIAAIKDPARAKEGQAIFQGKCVACHGDRGQGVIGPNLTDDYWIHGGAPAEIAHTITSGVLDKGMPPWGTLLKPGEIQSLVAFIRSIHGTNPPGAKAPQGTLVKGAGL